MVCGNKLCVPFRETGGERERESEFPLYFANADRET